MEAVATLTGVTKRFGAVEALRGVDAAFPAGAMTGLVGPDGAGKTTLIRLLTGLVAPTSGRVDVLGSAPDSEGAGGREHIGYMPQRFGLYEDLSVVDNLHLYAELRGIDPAARDARFSELLAFTGLAPFTTRLAGDLSGGMKQKLGLACALLGRPRLLLLDEPTVGVDPLSRRELWQMVGELLRDGVTVLWSTAYLDEAERCPWILLLDRGRTLYEGAPSALSDRLAGRVFNRRVAPGQARSAADAALARSDVVDSLIQGSSVRIVYRAGATPEPGLREVAPRLEDAYVDLLGGATKLPSRLAEGWPQRSGDDGPCVAARSLTKRFGDFTAADAISFEVRPGEIYGLLGPNGAGKSTTFRMLCGLLRPTAGEATVAGVSLLEAPSRARGRLGYMAQRFSLYGELSAAQNLSYFADIYGLDRQRKRARIDAMIAAFDLADRLDIESATLPLGFKQRLALACATLHAPPVLFLDEPTSGVDPIMRREFWRHIHALTARGVAVLVTTHFMDEAEYCDRIGIVWRGRKIAEGSPDELKSGYAKADGAEATLEETFVRLIEREREERA